MSECVVRMEMPNECPCELWHNCNPYVKYSMAILDASVERFPRPKPLCNGCRIIGSLPEGHGRLVDEKSVRWAIDDIVLEIANRTGRVWMTKDETMEYINNLCTIVPAEK